MKGNSIFKTALTLALLATCSLSGAFAKGAAKTGEAAAAAEKSKALVLYFSRADENYSVGTITEGNTAVLAKMIAQKTGADIFEIVPQNAYPKNYRECTDVAKDEQRKNARPAYVGNIDTAGYDTVYIGYPIWWGDLPMVVYTFLDSHDLNGKTIVPFCTHEGSGVSGTDAKLMRKFPNATVKTALAVRGATAQNKRTEAEKLVSDWLLK